MSDEEGVWTEADQLVRAHYSSLTLHRKCAQAWYYRYGLELSRPVVGPAPELYYGLWWGMVTHADALERGRQMGSLVYEPRSFKPLNGKKGAHIEFDQRTVTVKDVLLASKTWWDGLSQEDQDACVGKMGETLPRRLRDAYIRWRDQWETERRYERPLGTEVYWERYLPVPSDLPEWEIVGDPLFLDGQPMIKLIGFIDEIYWDSQREMVTVRDNKFYKSLGDQTAIDDMMDSQLHLYGWGVSPDIEERFGHPVRAVAYDRVKSTAPTKPKLTLAGKLSASVTQFDLRTYLDWVAEGQDYPGLKKDGSGAGTYQFDPDVVTKLSTPQWQHQFANRTQRPLNRNLVRAHLRSAADTAVDIWRTQRRSAVQHEVARSLGGACTWCDFKELCRAQMFGGPDGEYDLREFGLSSRNGSHVLVDGVLQ